uniref:FAR1 domain-containing protein n=1 Tax=Arundo donax TaxID=35708 RepID=A0A0A9HHP5_ARUDO
MTFGSEDKCYSFYNKYARDKGFSIRKDVVRREKKVGDIFYRRYLCSKEGS